MILEAPGSQIDDISDPIWMSSDASMPVSSPDLPAAERHCSMSVLKVLGPRSNILFRAVESPQNR